MPTAPQVPGLVPNAVPTATLPNLDLPVPVDAFGGAVGRALEGLGSSIEQGSDRIWQRAMDLQNLQNETEAKNADAKYMMESGKMHADFINKEGENAGPEALAKHIQDLQDKRNEIRASISNPRAQSMYDASSLSFMGRNIFNAAGHSGQQVKVAANNASDARIDMAQKTMGDSPEDKTNVPRMQRVIESEVRAKAERGGWTPEQTDDTIMKETSKGVGNQILGVSQQNAVKSQKMLNEAIANKAITQFDAEKLQNTITTKLGDQASRYITNKVLADRRAGEEEDEHSEDFYVDQGMKELDGYDIGLTEDQKQYVQDRVRNAIVTKYKQQRQIEIDADNDNIRGLGQSLLKANQEHQPPTTIEELLALDPKNAARWEGAQRDPRKAQAILKQLEHNADGTNRVPTTTQNLILTHQYLGMAQDANDETRAQFMAQSFATDNRLSYPQRERLMNLQDRMRANQATDPRLARAMKILEPDMVAAKYPILHRNNPQDYFQFKGQVWDALEQYGQDHPNKMPTAEEVKDIGRQIMAEQNASWYQSHQAFYQIQAPSDKRDAIAADPYWRGLKPDDSQIDRFYRAQLWRELHPAKQTTIAPTAAPAQPPNVPKSQ